MLIATRRRLVHEADTLGELVVHWAQVQRTYIGLLSGAGAVRTDLGVGEQSDLMAAVGLGFFTMPGLGGAPPPLRCSPPSPMRSKSTSPTRPRRQR